MTAPKNNGEYEEVRDRYGRPIRRRPNPNLNPNPNLALLQNIPQNNNQPPQNALNNNNPLPQNMQNPPAIPNNGIMAAMMNQGEPVRARRFQGENRGRERPLAEFFREAENRARNNQR